MNISNKKLFPSRGVPQSGGVAEKTNENPAFSNKKLIKGAVVLSAGGFLAKLIGALYRLPITNIIGSYGVGIYQMVFPLYTILLQVSSGGINSAVAKLISERRAGVVAPYNNCQLKNADGIFTSALFFVSILGFLGSVLMVAFSGAVSSLQGNADAALSYMLLAPSVFLVAPIAVFRGYFQGSLKMAPTALSQILEQIVKLIFSLFFALLFRNNIVLAAGMLCLSVTLSELAAAAFMYILFKKGAAGAAGGGKISFKGSINFSNAKTVVKAAVPITISGLILPLSMLADSFLVINILKKYTENSTGLYGLLSGAVYSVISLPVALAYGVAAAVLPLISSLRAQNDKKEENKKIKSAVLLTLLIALPSALFLFIFSNFTSNLLFFRLPAEEKTIISNLLKISAAGVVFLSLTQTFNSVLNGRGKYYVPVFNLLIAVLIKIMLNIILLNSPLGIYGGAVSNTVCYLVAFLLNFLYIIKDKYKITNYKLQITNAGI